MLHPAELINTSICPHAAVKSLTAAVTDSFEVISQESVRILSEGEPPVIKAVLCFKISSSFVLYVS